MKIFGKIDVLILIITLGLLIPMVFYNYDLFHSVAEFFSTLILLGIFIITWHTRDYHKNYYLTSVGIGFFFVGILNLIHVLNYNNLIIHGPYIEQWTIMQYFLAVTIIVPLLPKLKNTAKVNALFVVYSVATVLVILCIYFWNFFPKAYDYELKKLLPFKIYSEYVIMVILFGALLLLYRHRNTLEETEYKSSFFGITLMIFSEFCFTQYGATTEFFNALGHIFRVFTFYMFYKAYIYTCLRQPMDLIFGDLTHTQALLKESMKSLEQKVIDRTSELGETNYVLKQKVEEHKRAEAKFFNLFNTSPLPIIIADKNGKIILSNRTSDRVFGYEENELIGKSLDILIPEHLKVKHSQHLNKYMDMPHTRTMGKGVELVALRRNSVIFPVEVSLSPWKEGNETFVTAVINDITERKDGEDILRRKNIDLEKKNKELDSLLYSISHEIKAPISTMMGLSNIYRYELKNSLASEFVDHMDKAIKRLNDYVHNITTFATNTNPSLFSSDIEFESMISNLYNSCLKNEPVEKAINTLLEIKGDFPFKTDKSRLEVIFEQLISNAIQYHSREDKECFVKIDIDKTSSLLRVTVEDNGMGIHEHFLDKIFNMYFRGNYTSKGSGLGLYIVKEAVEKLGGNITVESNPFRGTKFMFELPTMA